MYHIEISAFADYNGLDKKPTQSELIEWITQFIDDLDKGYITPEISVYDDDEEEE